MTSHTSLKVGHVGGSEVNGRAVPPTFGEGLLAHARRLASGVSDDGHELEVTPTEGDISSAQRSILPRCRALSRPVPRL